MYDDFSDWVSVTHKLVSLMQKPDVWALFDHAPAETYTKGLICLLGDSAHASTPHQGAGAGMAIEDALVMSRVLAMVDEASDIPKAFRAYDAVRRPRSQKLVTTSREGGMLYEKQLEGVGDDIPLIQKHLEERMKWIWNVDLEAHVEEAQKLFTESTT